jgi:hypothetical protein
MKKKYFIISALFCLTVCSCSLTEYYGEGEIQTLGVTNVTSSSARLRGRITVENKGSDANIVIVNKGFRLYMSGETVILSSENSGEGDFECLLDNLDSETTYSFEAFAEIENTYKPRSGTEEKPVADETASVTVYGSTMEFTTERDRRIILDSIKMSGITNTSAAVAGKIISEGIPSYTERGLCYATSPDPFLETGHKLIVQGNGKGFFNATLTGLAPSTTYYVKAYAFNNEMIAYSPKESFTTYDLPSISSLQTEDVDGTSMSVWGEIISLGANEITDYGFCYSTTNVLPTVNDSKVSLGSTAETGAFKVQITGLEMSTKYYLRAYAQNSTGIAYGEVLQETTSAFRVALNLIAYYTFDNNDNANFLSETQGKSKYDGIKQGTGSPIFSSDIPGTIGNSLQLNSDAYYVMTESPIAAITSSYTMNVWVKTYVVTQTLFRYENTGSSNKPCIAFNSGYVYAEIDYDVSYYSQFNLDITPLVLDGAWHMLTVTRQAGVCKLFIDGNYRLSTNSNAIHTGRWYLGQGFSGKMDNFRVYNRELTQSEITEIYNAKQ